MRESDHLDLGFTDQACVGDVVRLCQLRGVQFAGGDQIDRRALEMLVRLLKREERTPTADWDWHLCCVVGEHVKVVMRTTANFEPPEPVPREPEPWDNPQRPELRKFIQKIKYDPYAEAANRCRCMGIRVGNAPNSKGERGLAALGFDLYRRLGLTLEGPYLMSERAIDAYREMMARAYNAVFASIKEHASV